MLNCVKGILLLRGILKLLLTLYGGVFMIKAELSGILISFLNLH